MTVNSQEIRWKQRFENLPAAYQLIKAFEMTFKLSWKTLKDFFNYHGIDAKSPREIIKQAFANDILVDGQMWINMFETRNFWSKIGKFSCYM